jgi:hypothetical protein
MSNLLEKLERLNSAAKARAFCKKPRIRVYAGALVTDVMLKLVLGIETAAQKLERWAESKRSEHLVGGKCPHCSGTGRYRFHTDASRNDKCYRCDGKGVLNARDLGFLTKRLDGAGPVCWVRSAVPA